ncbi:MAG: UvrD-helicase domain-containing protein [SAR324 cluster bacterium]
MPNETPRRSGTQAPLLHTVEKACSERLREEPAEPIKRSEGGQGEEERLLEEPAARAAGTAGPAGDDSAIRREALDPRASFIVRAPAGSGKTTLLIQRLLRLLAEAGAPEEIAAITFTRKAAAEMRERLLAALRTGQAAAAPAQDAGTWALARDALDRGTQCGRIVLSHPNRLRIQTIDAFCLGLARRHPWRSGLGGALPAREDAEPLYRQAARAALRALETGAQEGAAVAHLLRHRDVRVDTVEALLVQMLQRRDQWLRHLPAEGDDPGALRDSLERTLAGIVAGALAAIRRHAEEAARRLPGGADAAAALGARLARLTRHAAAHGDGALATALAPMAALSSLPGTELESLDAWRAVRRLLLTDAGDWRKPGGVNVKVGFPAGERHTPEALLKDEFKSLLAGLAPQDAFRDALQRVDRLPAPAYTDGQWETLQALVAVLRRAAACLREQFAQAGCADFVELAQAAERVARDDRGNEIGLRHLLVDEFQDSSHGQFRLLERLTSTWRPGDGRTLFLVGDPMQSIYRFREADVGLFLLAEGRGIGGLPLQALRLERNFRSAAEIVESNNRTFAAVFPARPDALRGAVPYAPAAAARAAAASSAERGGRALARGAYGGAVQMHALAVRDEDGGDGAEMEAGLVAEIARTALAAGASADVAILVQARTHLTAILPALGSAGVAIQAVALDPLEHRPAVLDALSLTRALMSPGDRIAWLSVLHAPWCGLGLADLEVLAGHGGTLWQAINAPATLAGLTAAGKTRVERVRSVLERARGLAGRRPLRETVERAWLALGGPACIAEGDRDDVGAYFAIVEEIEADGGVPSPEELSRRLSRKRSVPPAGTGPAVQVMTIHEAKGLEFDTVILPGLHRKTAGDTRPLLRWLELPEAGRTGLVLAPIPSAGGEVEAIHRYLDDVERARAENERQRLLYVACTRARERLHLVGVARATSDGVKPPRSGTLLAALWPTVEDRFAAAAAATARPVGSLGHAAAAALPAAAETAAAAAPTPAGLRLTAAWTLPALPPDLPAQPGTLPAGSRANMEETDEDPTHPVYEWAGAEARMVGRAVHALLQRIALQGIDTWSSRAGGAREGARRLLIQEGMAEAAAQRASGLVQTAIERCLADPRGRWLLGAHQDARVEWELTLSIGTRTRRIVLDRTFVDEKEVRWVVDYKTGTHAGGGLEAFLDEEQRRYRPQLDRYAQALRLQEPSRVIRCGLYFPLMREADGAGGWREWPFLEPESRK